MQTKVRAVDSSGDEVDLKASDGGVLWTDMARYYTAKGYGYQTMTTAGVAALVARPAALSLLTLYNNTGNKHFVIERAMAFNLVTTAAAGFFSIWLCVHPTGMAVPAGNNIAIRNSTSGLSAGTLGVADTDEAVADNGWFPWGPIGQCEAVGVLPSGAVSAEIGGRIIVPPTAGISIQVVASLVGETFTTGFHWFAVPEAELTVN